MGKRLKTVIEWRPYPEQKPEKVEYHMTLTASWNICRMKPSVHCTRWLKEWVFDRVVAFALPEDITTVEEE